MKDPIASSVNLKNRRAGFDFEIIDTLIAGIVLSGTEIKSVRQQKVNMQDCFCQFRGLELFLVNLHIAPYEHGTYNNLPAKRDRKLLLKKHELKKWQTKTEEKGLTIALLRLFIDEKGRCKAEIGLARGKKQHDKRESLKEKDLAREMRDNNPG
jgi:SsrA-binding protein